MTRADVVTLYRAFVFFLKAEDGIRDHCVTGVRTCALPISFAALPGAVLQGTVTRIGTSAQKKGSVVTYAVRVELQPGDPRLLASMTATVNIVTGQASSVLLVPNRFVRVDSSTGKAYAKVRQSDGTFQDTEIVLGLQNATVTEIKSGLQIGDAIALP